MFRVDLLPASSVSKSEYIKQHQQAKGRNFVMLKRETNGVKRAEASNIFWVHIGFSLESIGNTFSSILIVSCCLCNWFDLRVSRSKSKS
jgi:hypothetical protein